LGWGVRDLAERAELSPTTVSMVEAGKPHADATAAAIVAAFAAHGVEITNGEGTGARLLKKRPKRRARK
jgi:DNA-binding LacI/PurR family transcriptional regulator